MLIKILILLLLPLNFAQAAYKVGSLEVDPNCNRRTNVGCPKVDSSTSPKDTAFCTGYWGANAYKDWQFRTNTQMIDTGNWIVRPRIANVRSGGAIGYGSECKRFAKKKLLVKNRIALSYGFPLVTYTGDLCGGSPTVAIHRSDKDPWLQNVLGKPVHPRNRTPDYAIVNDPVSFFYVGNYKINQVGGRHVLKVLRGVKKIVEMQCGELPDSIVVEGVLALAPKLSKSGKAIDKFAPQVIYEGTYYPTQLEFSIPLQQSIEKLEHTNLSEAQEFVAWAEAKTTDMNNRIFQSQLQRLERRRKAQRGAMLLYFFAAALHMSSICNAPDINHWDKPSECTSYW